MMSIARSVSWLARRTFWPRRPIARLSWSSGTTTSIRFFLLVDHDAGDGRRLQRVDDEGREVLAPRDDVDLLALQLLDHGLDAAALHADAGADRVDRAVVADHADLGAAARIAGGGLDLDDAVVNLGHFLREQLLHEIGMRAAEEDLRPAVLAANVQDQRADAVADADDLARDLLVAADHALGAAEIDDDVAELDALDDAGDDLAGAVLELLDIGARARRRGPSGRSPAWRPGRRSGRTRSAAADRR